MTERTRTDVPDVDADVEVSPYTMRDALLADWKLWLAGLILAAFAVFAAVTQITDSPFDTFLFGATAVTLFLGAAADAIDKRGTR